MENRLTEILKNYNSFSEEDEEKVYIEILKIADSQTDKFSVFIQKQEQGNYGILIDALSKDTKKWSKLFFNEIKRIFTEAEDAENVVSGIMFLDEFVYIESNKFLFSKEIIDFVKPYLKHKHPVFRYWALSLISYFMNEYDTIMIKLIEKYLTDEDWRIRYWAYMCLTKIKGNKKYKLSFSDKIRSKINDPYKFD